MRNDCLGGLHIAISDVVNLSATVLIEDNEETREAQTTILRYCTLSLFLLNKQAIGDRNLNDLVEQGLLTEDEQNSLAAWPSQASIVWIWIMKYWMSLERRGMLLYADKWAVIIQDITFRARKSITILFTYLDSQLPYRYVHLLAMFVWFHNFTQVVTSAFNIVSDIENQQWIKLGVEFFYLFGLPFIYLSLLRLGEHILNPFRQAGSMDFPLKAFIEYRLEESLAFFEAGNQPPFETYYKKKN